MYGSKVLGVYMHLRLAQARDVFSIWWLADWFNPKPHTNFFYCDFVDPHG